jgi:hypothetical protein
MPAPSNTMAIKQLRFTFSISDSEIQEARHSLFSNLDGILRSR